MLAAFIAGFAMLDIARFSRPVATMSLDAFPGLAGLLEEPAGVDPDLVLDNGLNLLLEDLLS